MRLRKGRLCSAPLQAWRDPVTIMEARRLSILHRDSRRSPSKRTAEKILEIASAIPCETKSGCHPNAPASPGFGTKRNGPRVTRRPGHRIIATEIGSPADNNIMVEEGNPTTAP